MGSYERRMAVWRVLCVRRQESVANLAAEFRVSNRTMYYDVQYLSLHFPVVYVQGRYTGGIRLADGYTPGTSVFSPEELKLLLRLQINLKGQDAETMHSILLKCVSA